MARDDRPRIGRQLRRAMERARLDQSQVAAALGVSRNAVNAWMNDRAYPMNSLGALEDLLDVTFDEEPAAPARGGSLEERFDDLQRQFNELRRHVFGQEPGKGEDNGASQAG
jgi:transcriptional regulator with XRE-family HTH domain